jgi:uncharacterized protein (DUF305 family)
MMVVRICAALLAAALMLGAAAPQPDDTARPGAVDIGFSQDMAVHHDQAVLMARLVRERASPPIRQLASQIEANQVQEIGVLRGWLLLWNQPALAAAPMLWMSSNPGVHGPMMKDSNAMTMMKGQAMADGGATMPGLASQAELDALQKAQGVDIDKLFLRMMIKHHLGGINMLRAVKKGAALPVVRSMARNMELDEMQEIVYMDKLGQRLGMATTRVSER